ncbi:MAG TPA: DUF262 domain-containing protein, partial [Acidimicrobiales bacterium]|nr:DUF262 domain-containing protein [Acidimicrobiales bacterium]
MPGTKISAEEATVGKVFSDEYQFTVPPYQRSYTWTTEQAGELFDDHLPTDSQRHILLNLRLFLDHLDALAPDRREALAQFIDRHTYLVVAATQDFESAYRIFTVLNERGLDLSHTDILKAGVVGELPDDDKAAYTAKWQAEEEALGRDGFADLFAHIRMVFAKTKARETI